MTVTEKTARSLSTGAARNLATTTKSVPNARAITPRWLLRMLPWTEAHAGTYRVNRRLAYPLRSGQVGFTTQAGAVRVIPGTLREIRPLAGVSADDALSALAERFTQREYAAGDTIAEAGRPAGRLILIADGKVTASATGKYGHQARTAVLAEGDHLGEEALLAADATWRVTAQAATACTTLEIPRNAFDELDAYLAAYAARERPGVNKRGEASIELASGHAGEKKLPGAFADYETSPREYELHVAQTVLHVHSRVADLFNDPMNQVEHQLRLTIEALRERQEHELINNPDIGLLRNADLSQRIHTRTGPPTPDDMDELLSRRRKTRFFLAHPRAIAAFGRQCSRRGVYPEPAALGERTVHAWRGVPLLPCDKIPVTASGTTSILAMRTGVKDQGVIGLHQTGLPDEREPGLSVRFMNVDDQAIISYLISAYFSAAVLVPDALGVLENVEL